MFTLGSQNGSPGPGTRFGLFLLVPLTAAALLAQAPPEKERERRSEGGRGGAQREGQRTQDAPRQQAPAPRQQEAQRPQQPQRPAAAEPRVRDTSSPGARGNAESRVRDNSANRRQDQQPRVAAPTPTVQTEPRAARPENTRPQQRTQSQPGTFRGGNSADVRYHPDGRVSDVRKGDMSIQHGVGNSRRIVVQRTDRTVIVTNRAGNGFVQRPFAYRGQEFVNRTYYRGGSAYSRYYRPYNYRGYMLNSYVPVRYYQPGFYSWFASPWGASISFSWGWNASPWYGYYRGYFSPSPYYSSPGYWLADYIISSRLAEAYADGNGRAPLYDVVPLSNSVKQEVALEVERQLALERLDAESMSRNEIPDPQGSFPRMLADNNPHVFVVSYSVDVTVTDGQNCSVTRGDVLRLVSPPQGNSSLATLQVIAGKPGSCRIGSLVTIGVEDLQDLYNQMRESVSQGMDELRSKAGQNGVPSLPRDGSAAAMPSPFVESAPPPDPGVAAELKREALAAEQLEREVAGERGDLRQSPVTIAIGQTVDQVENALGSPKHIVNLGARQIYVYPQLKITFLNGKVSNVE